MSPSTDTPLPSREAGSANDTRPKADSETSTPSKGRPLGSSGKPLSSTAAVTDKLESVLPGDNVSAGEKVPKETSEAEEGSDEEGGEDGDEDGDEEDEEEDEKGGGGKAGGASTAELAARRQTELRKSFGRFILFFLGFMGLYMLIDANARNSIALTLGLLLAPAFGFDGRILLATMFLTAALEMGLSALAYHFTTDWIETATVQHHQASIRPLWMKAVRGQKKEHMEALKPHMDSLNMRQSRVTIAQLKGMVITWVLLIAIYTWMGLYIADQCPKVAIEPAQSTILAPAAGPFLLNSSVNEGHAPYSFRWWMQGTASNGPLNGENATGPVNSTSWVFQPPADGVYLITLQITDHRGSVGWAFQGLQYHTQSPTPSTTPPPPSCKGTSLVLFGAEANLMGNFGPFPLWFAAFSLYTVPLNLIFRRYLKHVALAQKLPDVEEAHAAALASSPLSPGPGGGSPP